MLDQIFKEIEMLNFLKEAHTLTNAGTLDGCIESIECLVKAYKVAPNEEAEQDIMELIINAAKMAGLLEAKLALDEI